MRYVLMNCSASPGSLLRTDTENAASSWKRRNVSLFTLDSPLDVARNAKQKQVKWTKLHRTLPKTLSCVVNISMLSAKWSHERCIGFICVSITLFTQSFVCVYDVYLASFFVVFISACALPLISHRVQSHGVRVGDVNAVMLCHFCPLYGQCFFTSLSFKILCTCTRDHIHGDVASISAQCNTRFCRL